MVISNNSGYTITFIDIVKKESITTYQAKYFLMGLAASCDTLFYTVYGYCINTISLHNNSKTQFYYFKSEVISYVATYEDKICYTDSLNNVVVLLDLASKIIWTYKNKTLLKSLTKVTFDKQGNIYVVGQSTYNIVFISNDGQKSRQVLSKTDGIMSTMSIVFDSNKNRLIVASILGDVEIYNCS